MKKRSKRAQIQSQVFVYILVAIIMGFLLMFSYKSIKGLGEKKVEHEMILFQEKIKKDIESWALHIGSVGEESYGVPSFITRACFVDLSRRDEILSQGFFDDYPLVIDSLETTENNMFLFDEKDNFYSSVHVGEVNLLSDYNCQPFTCFDATNNVLNLLFLGRGHSTLILPADVDKDYIISCDCPNGCRIRPIANFTFVGNMQYIPVLFNVSASYDIDDYIVEYFWEFGDGENQTTQTLITQHIYNDVQNYEVKLTAIDVDGLKGIFSDNIMVIPYKLIANAGGDKPVKVGSEVVFDGSNSIGRIVNYHWSFGDIRDKQDDGKVITFRYVQSGSKVVTLNVTDVFGNSAIDKINVEVTR
jgi:hypothetical protein